MPYLDHNSDEAVAMLFRELQATKQALKKLRFSIEKGNVDSPPERILSALGLHASRLAQSIRLITVRHEVYQDDQLLHSAYENPIVYANDYANNMIKYESHLIPSLLEHDRSLYTNFGGFSDQEYDDLMSWCGGLIKEEIGLQEAFDYFVDYILRDLQNADAKLKPDDIIPAVTGLLGIGIDVWAFLGTADAPALVGSCITGIGSIASKISTVREKLSTRNSKYY